ncbi:PREDICTED: ATP-binding cassette sub-family A member 2-like, partial [Bison bison bison]|uniref:ATP-binding cassette sub-family A member 2-like n=1 Tax=Bison bison bison TaxID=43346 RepID=A0A6P3I0Y0_BISBB
MDEADLLGDRIAIISHGKLKCCGSPLFLKGAYGDGYRLTLVKRPAEPGGPQEPGLTASPPGPAQLSSCSESQVSQFIRKHVASCLLVSDTSTELSYILPSEAAKKGAFERLFQHLEHSLDALHLSSFGLMDTTLEEVFLKVSEEDQSLENSEAGGNREPGDPRVVKWALEKLELTKYADKPAGTYSGGNKRKLSTAIALIGYPAFIFL